MTTQTLSRFPTLDIQRPRRSVTTFLNYSKQLEEFIVKYKTRPRDIKFWPYGPYWPQYYENEVLVTPRFLSTCPGEREHFHQRRDDQNYPTVESQLTPYLSKWRGVLIVYDSERSSREHSPSPVPQGCCPNLLIESRFESGNLRQARRVGQFEYELVLRTDLYTNRHTQWYYFRVQNAVPGITYRFRIVNLLKNDSLYNYGMKPLMYSDNDAKNKNIGWVRTGHHISYSRNVMHLHCPLLMRGVQFYELEWQMEFPNENDTYHLAHCYPYTFTDLKDDLEFLLNEPDRQGCITREVLCETRAGNSCFLVTVTNFDQPEEVQEQKKAVILTARVHPGEPQSSWMIKGVLDFITSSQPVAQELRNKFIFKIVPMLNPDGVIVGNYRCSLSARDLNRNYRHPRKDNFPTVWHTKNMIETVMEKHEVALYCDLHGHSRKHNVFMYGNNISTDDPDGLNNNGVNGAQAFLNERLFPWLMSQKSPEKFSFPFCKFNIARCKESTGRVVMWRQMRIPNSFTLEATFSGTAMNREECRHFNISDYLEMGQILCLTVLEYQQTQENKARQIEIVLQMTRYITGQILERRRGVIYKMPNLKAFVRQEQANKMEEDKENSNSSHELPMEQDNSSNDNVQTAFAENVLSNESELDEETLRKSKRTERANALSSLDVDKIIDAESMKTMDGCLKILDQLNVTVTLEESDSSDSDSESEPEMKPPSEPKQKKKKRKSKKQRDKEQQERKSGTDGSDKKEENTLSAIKGEKCGNSQKKENFHFVSKYEGRKNGGIPCFAEERSVERAAKRMAEIKKRTEEDKRKELTFFCVDDSALSQCGIPRAGASMPTLQRSLTNYELQRRLQVALNEGTSNIAQTLVGFNVRTGYTHADSFRDLAPAALPATAAQHNSSSELSDSESEPQPSTIPVAARTNPYHQETTTFVASTYPSLMPNSSHARHVVKKQLSLRTPVIRSMSRQINASATPPVSLNYHSNLTRPPDTAANQTERPRSQDRKKNPGPLQAKPEDETIRQIYGQTKLLRSRSELNLSKDYMKILLERIRNNPTM